MKYVIFVLVFIMSGCSSICNGGWTTKRHHNYPTTDLPVEKISSIFALIMETMSSIVEKLKKCYCLHEKFTIIFRDLFVVKYKENAQISVTRKKDTNELESIVFKNQLGDFTNVYRLMGKELVNTQINSVKFKEPNWNINFEPLVVNIQRFKYQSQALGDCVQFQSFTDKGNLYFEIGEPSSHQGNFVFHTPVTGKLVDHQNWPVKQVLAILGLAGDKRMKISEAGAMQITVDSGVAEYKYIIPAQMK